MDSLGRAVVVLVLAIVLAGCGGTDGEGDQATPTATGGDGGADGGDGNQTEETPPEPQELLNETLDYARAPEQEGQSTSFDAPADMVALRLTYQGEHDCPEPSSLGYQDDAQVVFVDPNGEEYRENLFDSGAGTVDCNNPPIRQVINPEPVAGLWDVRAEGVYTGMVNVTAVANPPGSSA